MNRLRIILIVIGIIIMFGLMTLLNGCTHGSFNPDTKEFYFTSTKEFDSFEITYKHIPEGCSNPGTEITIKATKVKAFKGQKQAIDVVKDVTKSLIKPF